MKLQNLILIIAVWGVLLTACEDDSPSAKDPISEGIDSLAFLDSLGKLDSLATLDSLRALDSLATLDSLAVLDSLATIDSLNALIDPRETEVISFLPDAGTDKAWRIQENLTNEFEDPKSSEAFTTGWEDKFFNGWTGPGATRYTPSRSSIIDGHLVFKAQIVGNTIETGCVSSKQKVGYPMYMETRAKISKSVLSSAVWMLSDDSTEEIDNLEAYGSDAQSWYVKRLHLSHHVFIRDPFQDYQPTSTATWYTDGRTVWSNAFHTYGVLWMGPNELSYYVDGKLVRTVPENEIDPKNFTNGAGLTKDMYLILSQAAQPWRESVSGFKYLTDPTVTDSEKTITSFDWIRVYKPE